MLTRTHLRPATLLVALTLLALTLPPGHAAAPTTAFAGTPAALTGASAGATAIPPTPGEVLVRYQPGFDAAAVAGLERGLGAQLNRTIDALDVRILAVPVGAEDAVVAALAHHPAVAFAERNPTGAVTTDPNDPYYLSQASTSLNQVRAATAWSITTGAGAPLVAVVDTGVSGHPDLAGKVIAGYDYVNNDADPTDDNGHGTMVAGIIGAASNNATGITADCWGCQVLAVKVLNSAGSGSYSAIASGITYAADHGARVINLSLGGSTDSSTLKAAVDYAIARGAAVVAAAGNSGCACILYPAAYPNAIAVGSVDKTNLRYSYSNYGPALDLVAPGTNWSVSSTSSTGYAAFSGTSSATPVVSALAALVLTMKPLFGPTDVATAIASTTVDLGTAGRDDQYGWGLVDYYAAVSALKGGATAPSPTPTPTPGPTPTPSPTPTPTPGPTPTPTPAPTTSSVSWSGSVSNKQPSRAYALTTGTGTMTATFSASGVPVVISIVAADGTIIAASQASSGATISAGVTPGSYTVRVTTTGGRASFKLTVTYPIP